MKWREVGRREEVQKLSLSAVLDHYNWRYSPSRGSQMIQCLFHEDRTPSMSINLVEQVFNCHSCGEGGDAYTLLMKKEGLDFAGARELATSLGISDGDARGGGGEVSGSRYATRRSVPKGSGDRQSYRNYVPSWRRK